MHLTYDLINQADWFNNFLFDLQSTLYLWHLLGVHCSCSCLDWCFASSAHKKISMRTWFFQTFFNKSLIKFENFASCHAILGKIWEMTRNLSAHPAQLLNPTISKFCHSSYMVIITLHNSKILLSLHCFLTPQFQTFTNLITGIFGVRNLTFFFFFNFFFWDR